MVWDKANPPEGGLARNLNDEIRINNAALEATMTFGHDFVSGGSQTGEHNEGSAVIFSGALAPTTKEDGITALDANDVNRRLWLDTANGLLKLLTAVGPVTWTAITQKLGMLDEDNFVSDSATVPATQQSIKAYVDTQDATKISADGSIAFTADQSMGSKKLTNVADPVDDQDAATKAFVSAIGTVPVFKLGTYIGNDGTSSTQDIVGLGFDPNFVLVWGEGNAFGPMVKTSAMPITEAKACQDGAMKTASIPAFISDGFRVEDNGGSSSSAHNMNDNLKNYYYIAAKLGT